MIYNGANPSCLICFLAVVLEDRNSLQTLNRMIHWHERDNRRQWITNQTRSCDIARAIVQAYLNIYKFSPPTICVDLFSLELELNLKLHSFTHHTSSRYEQIETHQNTRHYRKDFGTLRCVNGLLKNMNAV